MFGARYLAALVLTLLVEISIALLVHHRVPLTVSRVHLVQTVVLVNLMTHPLLNYLLWLNAWMQWIPSESMVAILEIAVVFAEWRMLVFALGGSSRTLFGLSLAMNSASFVGGLIAFHS